MGMVSAFGFAQNAVPVKNQAGIEAIGNMVLDARYLNSVQAGMTPNVVKQLENLVSVWDVTQHELFDGRPGDLFHITFKSEQGAITALYDDEGQLIMALERFKDVALPYAVSSSIVEEYPEWEIVKNRYSVRYQFNDESRKVLKVLIRKGNQRQWLKIGPSGIIS